MGSTPLLDDRVLLGAMAFVDYLSVGDCRYTVCQTLSRLTPGSMTPLNGWIISTVYVFDCWELAIQNLAMESGGEKKQEKASPERFEHSRAKHNRFSC